MSRENLEVVRRIYEAVTRRDANAAYALYAEDIVWDASNWAPGSLMTRPVFHGHEGVRQAWRETLSVWEAVDFEVPELVDVGDQVVAAVREREVGRTSGVTIEAAHGALWTLSGGKVVRLEVFDDYEQALAAASKR